MMNKNKWVIGAVIVIMLSLTGVIVWGTYSAVVGLIRVLTGLDPNVTASLVAGSLTLLGSVAIVVLTRHFQSLNDQRVAHRDRKVAIYDNLLNKLFTTFAESHTPESETLDENTKASDMVSFMREVQRDLLLWSGPGVLRAYANWRSEIIRKPLRVASLVGMVDLFLAIRSDLGHSNRLLKREHVAAMLLQKPDLIMAEYQKNPDMLMEELVALEKKHEGLR